MSIGITLWILWGGFWAIWAGLLLINTFRRRDQELDIEKQNVALYSEYVGGRFDAMNFTVPLVRISIYDRFLVISYWAKIVLEYSEIVELNIQQHLISTGLHIYHHQKNIPDIIIWSRNCQQLQEKIETQRVNRRSQNEKSLPFSEP